MISRVRTFCEAVWLALFDTSGEAFIGDCRRSARSIAITALTLIAVGTTGLAASAYALATG